MFTVTKTVKLRPLGIIKTSMLPGKYCELAQSLRPADDLGAQRCKLVSDPSSHLGSLASAAA